MYQPKFFKGAVLALCFLSFAIFSQAQDCQHQALIDKMDKGMAEKDINLMDEIYHADAVRHTPDGDQEGLEKIKASAAEFYKNVPDAKGENVNIICTDDYIVSRWVGSGTPQGSEKKVEVTGITIMKVKDGKIVEEWEEMNTLGLMMQMGYELKPPAGADN